MATPNNIIGKVFEASLTNDISFVSTKYYANRFVKISMDHVGKDIFLIGEVISVKAANPYFEKPATVRYIEDNDETISIQSIFISKLRPIAFLRNDISVAVDFPPSPGSIVLAANKQDVQIAMGLEKEGLNIGQLKDQKNLPVIISPSKLFRTHFSILGRTGSGKSYFTKGLIKKIPKDIKFVIFSPSDEYNELNNDIDCTLYKSTDINFPFEIGYLSLVFGFTLREQSEFEKFCKNLNEKDQAISSQDIQKRFKEWFLNKQYFKTQNNLFPESDTNLSLKELPQFGDTILSKIRQKDLTFAKHPLKVPFDGSAILDMSELTQETQELVITYTLNNLLQSYKKLQGKRTVIIIEEAHNFAPSVQTTFCKEKIIQTAREGRKLGLNICLISQRPRHIDQTVLSQAGTLFLFNIPHPDDIQHVLGIAPAYSSEMPETVRKLNVGECLVVGDVVQYPLVCKIDFN